MSWIVAVVSAYLLGSIPFSYLFVKARTDHDIRKVGSGNVGATNVLRVAGKGAALFTLLCDVGKGVAAVLLSQRLTDSPAAGGVGALAAVLGHVRPVFLRSGGGKGGATALGALIALAPAAGAACILFLALVIAWTRYVSLATIVVAAASPVVVLLAQRLEWVRDAGAWLPIAVSANAAVILIRHRDNLRRLRAGLEPKLGEPWRPRAESLGSTPPS